MKDLKMPDNRVGLVDADLLSRRTRHPNLALLKIAGYLKDHGIEHPLIVNGDNVDFSCYERIYVSKVFTFTEVPPFIAKARKELSEREFTSKIRMGGTGWYATETDLAKFLKERDRDMHSLENDPDLPGINMRTQMPDYDLYTPFVETQIAAGAKRAYYKDYLDYSIGFLTRGCFRKCPFCVNKNESTVTRYSELKDFLDPSRKYIYLWDDNFLFSDESIWRPALEELNATKKPFQFRQGLDLRLIDDQKAEILGKSRYHGDFIFAFDNWSDRDIIVRKLSIWKKHCAHKTTKFYLFCGFQLTNSSDDKLYEDVLHLFMRIQILMRYGCLGYVMRHEDYHNHPLGNIYTQIARWCNQPQFYKKMSFKEFIDRNQSYQEETTGNKKTCKSLSTYNEFVERFHNRMDEIKPFFDMKYEATINPPLWE